jgi:alkaline phosphatase D
MAVLTRRSFLAGAGASAVLAASPAIVGRATERRIWASNPFSLGVASGSPSPDGFVLWTRLAPDPLNYDAAIPAGMTGARQPVAYEIAGDAGMKTIVRRGTAFADPDFGYSVHAEIAGLAPGRPYWYRFMSGTATSEPARATTTPARTSTSANLRFGFVSCANYQHGYYAAYRHLAEENPDLVIFLGDYIYEGVDPKALPSRRHSEGVEADTLARYRSRYAQYKRDPDLQSLHRAATNLMIWDDHEVQNDYANESSQHLDNPATFLLRRAAAYRAFYEHMPLRASAKPNGAAMRIYDRCRFGDLVEFSLLDGRQYRSREACYGPGKGGGHLESNASCPDRLDERRSMIGLAQERWLFDGLAQSRARWNVIAQDVLMAQYRMRNRAGEGAFSTDDWDGYPASRTRLLQHIADSKVANPVVIGGDIHSYFANDLKLDFDNQASPAVASEFVGTSISSNPAPYEAYAPYLSDNPHVRFFESRKRGYVMAELTRDRLTSSFRAISDGTDPNASIETLKAFVVENGKAGPVEA